MHAVYFHSTLHVSYLKVFTAFHFGAWNPAVIPWMTPSIKAKENQFKKINFPFHGQSVNHLRPDVIRFYKKESLSLSML